MSGSTARTVGTVLTFRRSADVPLTVGAIAFAVTAIAAIAAFSARETYRIPVNDLGNPDAAPMEKHDYDRQRAASLAGVAPA